MGEQISFDGVNNKNKHYIQEHGQYAKTYLNPIVPQSYIIRTANSKTNADIKKLLSNPLTSYKELQGISRDFEYRSRAYTNIAWYNASIITFDYIIAPNTETVVKDKTLWGRYLDAARIAKTCQVKSNFPSMLYRTLVNGETFWYDLSDKTNVIFKEIPSSVCKMAMIDDDNLWRYYVDLNLIDSNELMEYPKEIRIAYKNYMDNIKQDSQFKNKKYLDSEFGIEIYNYLYLVTKKGFAMGCHMMFELHDYPYFSNMFVDVNNYESDKEYYNELIKDNNTKLVHFEVPLDKMGEPTVEYDDIRKYHEAAKSHVPNNVKVLTNPFKPTGITLDKSQQQAISSSDNSRGNMAYSSGISETMWNASTTNGLKYSVEADAAKMKPLMKFFEDLMNYKMKESKMTFQILKEINQYNKIEWYKLLKDGMGSGDLRSGFMSAGVYEPYDYIVLARMEEQLDFDGLLKPKLMSAQMSGSEEAGAPVKNGDDRSDETVVKDDKK